MQEKAAQFSERILEIADDDALNSVHITYFRADKTVPLDGVDEGSLVATGAKEIGLERLVERSGRIQRLAKHGIARKARQTGAAEVIAHPIGGRIGVDAVRNTGSASRGEEAVVNRGIEDHAGIDVVTAVTVVYGDVVEYVAPGRCVQYTVVLNVEVITDRPGEIFYQ